MADSFDAVVIGGGPGGYNAAIRLGQLGLSVACIDKRGTFGGTCLNIGCIPSKALLYASERFEEAGHMLARMGVKVGAPQLDLPAMMAFKDEAVAADGKSETLDTKAIVIATGSDVARLKGVDIDEKRIVSSTGALVLDKVPERLLVVGAGVIGLELGSVWRRLGAEVIVVEFLDRILPGMDSEICRQVQRIFERQGIRFKLSSKVAGIETGGKKLKITIEPAAGGKAESIEADVALVSIGRVPFTEGLGLEAAGVKIDNKRRIFVDPHFATNVPGIYAIGDVIAGPMLAHKAMDEGVAVAEILAGEAGHMNYDVIPNVVYTYPEIASVGKSEEELKDAGTAYNVGKFP